MEVTSAAVKQYRPLVGRLAHQMMARLPANIEKDDLEQVGLIGLTDAMSRFDAENSAGASFETFATQRIRGAMLDELRRCDIATRSARRQRRETATAVCQLEHRLGRAARDGEIAAAIGVPLADYQQQQTDASTSHEPLSLDDAGGGEDDPLVDRLADDGLADPFAWLVERGRREALIKAIGTLRERDQQVMSMRFEGGMFSHEIAQVLGVTESCVCQILKRCVAQLQVKLWDWR